MSDNRQVYGRIKAGLKQLYPGQLSQRQANQLETIAAMVTGIVQSKASHLEAMARKAPDGAKVESRVKRYSRSLQNEQVDAETYYLPYVEAVLWGLAEQGSLVVVMDGSEVGRNCLALMISVIYHHRALPLGWVVVEGNKGHFPETTHLSLLAKITALIPEEADVIFLGDGEFDGVDLQAHLHGLGWHYVCRTAHNAWVVEADDGFALDQLALEPGQWLELADLAFTHQAYGPVLLVAWWAKDQQAPLYRVSNFDLAEEAIYWYPFRFRIETFFSDQKSRGFQLHKSHLADPDRLARLLIAACLAYLWLVYLGALAHQDLWLKLIHRPDRCDLSLFQLGLRLLDHFLNEDLPLPFSFHMPLLC